MTHTRLWISASIIALIVVGGFVLSVPHTRDSAKVATPLAASSSVPSVALRDVFKKGMHTITGSIVAPNACSTVSAQSSLQGDASSTQSILVQVSLPGISGVCLEVPTTLTFQTMLAAPARLPFTATVNDAPATTSML